MKLVDECLLENELATVNYASQFSSLINRGDVIFLSGQLGAGKTTLVRGLLRFWGYKGPVKSPTYTLLEPYETSCGLIYHFDFFRIEDAEELTFIGMDELLDRDAIKFIEWSENVVSELPKPNIKVSLQVEGTGRYARVYENR